MGRIASKYESSDEEIVAVMKEFRMRRSAMANQIVILREAVNKAGIVLGRIKDYANNRSCYDQEIAEMAEGLRDELKKAAANKSGTAV